MPPVRRGVHPQLEAEADRMIRESLKGVTKHSAKADILTPWKQQERLRREVYVESGTPDPATRRGVFHRSVNPARPQLNSRDGIAPNFRALEGLQAFIAEHGGSSDGDQ